ncbi:hypothetical protein [Lysinibacillus xylanilyticus]|uniref:isopeptide-forming domain-containing fimbrial protein n=1 Tax=Lysinibacillus xylanilyticus TaxID=582475 RepID=UPI003D967949
MRKMVISMLVFVLVFSELNVFVAETIVGDPTELEIECEKQLESDEENLATECKEPETENGENPTTEGEGRPETENGENLTTEGEGQPDTGNGENPTTEGEGQPDTGNGENPTTEGEGQPETENGDDPATEGEGQPGSENGEDPTTEEEEQPEYGLEPLCVEQSEFEIEENSTTEGEEQLESNSEEELTTEDEEQLGSNSEEVLVFEGEEQLGTNSEEELENNEEKPAPNCKRATRAAYGKGILISNDKPKIKDIDFSALDDSENELDDFTQMTVNRGLEIPQRNDDRRTYYMYFGDFFNDRTYSSLNMEKSYEANNDDWDRPLPEMEQTLRQVIKVNGDKDNRYIHAENYQVALALNTCIDNSCPGNAVATYFYQKGRPSIQTNDTDIGSGMMIAHGSSLNGTPGFRSEKGFPLLKLYKNETTHELIGYAAVINEVISLFGNNKLYVDGYVRIKMSPLNGKGRIRVNMRYLKLSDDYAYTNFAYSAHMDIAGRHTNSKIYSLGDNKGFYFNEAKLADNKDYVLYFYRDGYEEHPTAFKANNDPINYPFSSAFFGRLNGVGTAEPGKGLMTAFQDHPGWALRWDPQKLAPAKVREVNLEMALSDSLEEELGINLDNDCEYKDDGYHISGTWNGKSSRRIRLYYTVDGSEPMLISEDENEIEDTEVPWEYAIPNNVMEKGLDHEITVYIMDEFNQKSNIETIKARPALDIKEQVFNQDGKETEEVAPGDTLSYKILVDSGYNLKDPHLYGQFTITQKYDTHLEPPTDLKVVDAEDGYIVGTATYNGSAIEVKVTSSLRRYAKVSVTFNAKVKDDATEEEYVVGQGTATGKYSTGDVVNGTSNEVKVKITGVLTFVSAPQEIDFGKKLAISPKNKKYYPIQLDRPLAVQDNRSLSRKPSWMMTAKLDQPLTGEKTGAKLDSLYYRYGENVSIITEKVSAEIYKKETKNREVVNISDTWDPNGDGLYLEVTAGTAKADAYKGTIRWELQDVPLNE